MTDKRVRETELQLKMSTLQSPLLCGNVQPETWLRSLKEQSGCDFKPQSICGRCKRHLTTQEIFKGITKTGVVCPKCRTRTPATLKIKKAGSREKEVTLLGLETTVEQLRLIPLVISSHISEIPAPQLNAIFWTGRPIE